MLRTKLETIEEAVTDLQAEVSDVAHTLEEANTKLDERLTRIEIKLDRTMRLLTLGVDDGQDCPSTLAGRVCTCACD